ncbi:CapA family protein [Ferribacterium limneticum]|uniref:CapA family protein n=1 Tax=Ferribacterium limneticum TaxID=76259 RepID=UPI001CF833C7|nr:CapA family protein [Ferribacterium limneticum]
MTLIFAGDVMLDDGPGRLIARGGDPLAPFAKTLRAADYRIANLETSVARSGKRLADKPYTFRAHPRTLRILQGRFDAVTLANNHVGDYGHKALLETMQRLDRAGIAHFGAGKNLAEAHKPLWIERQGLKIAILGYNEFAPRAFEAGADTPGTAWSEDDHVISDIRAAKAAGADLIIPFMHWGWEYEPAASQRLQSFARRMIAEGASMVVGSHPHVTQGADVYQGKPIIYSLGNFVFDGFEAPEARVGWLLRLKLDKTGVLEWDTLAAHMDKRGTPHPMPGALTPCGKAGDAQVAQCRNP